MPGVCDFSDFRFLFRGGQGSVLTAVGKFGDTDPSVFALKIRDKTAVKRAMQTGTPGSHFITAIKQVGVGTVILAYADR